MNTVDIEHAFDYADIHSDYLVDLLRDVLSILKRSVDFYDVGFGPVIEGPTASGEAGEVTEDGDIYLDPSQLQKCPRDVAMALVAHELAHSYLKHYTQVTLDESGLQKE